MFTHLLIPTDGSVLSKVAIDKGMQLAHSLRARVTGIFVMPEFRVVSYHAEMIQDNALKFSQDCRANADQALAVVTDMAASAGVECQTVSTTSDHPFEAIIDAATVHGCDIIVMASHGRGGMRSVLLGSQTQKVLTHCKIPVLILR